MASKTKTDNFVLLKRPICSCEMLPNGLPGEVHINGTDYFLWYNATLPREGEPILHGYRLVKGDGTCYDMPYDLESCECWGHMRWAPERGTDVCKHVRALRWLREQGKIA